MKFRTSWIVIALLLVAVQLSAQEKLTELRVSVIPDENPQELLRIYTPFTKYLSNLKEDWIASQIRSCGGLRRNGGGPRGQPAGFGVVRRFYLGSGSSAGQGRPANYHAQGGRAVQEHVYHS